MSNRKKKRARQHKRPPAPRPAGGNGTKDPARRQAALGGGSEASERTSVRQSLRRSAFEGARRAAGDRPRGLFGGRMREASPYPSLRQSFAGGLVAAGSSPIAVVLVFLCLGLVWVVLVASGIGELIGYEHIGARYRAGLVSVPPLFLMFPYERFLAFFPVVADSSIAGLAISVGLTLLRVVVYGAAIALMAPRLGWTEGRPWTAFRRALPHLLLIGMVFFGIGAAIPYLAGGILGNIGLILLLAGPVLGLHFLVFAPVIAVLEGAGYRDSLRRSTRAARLPGAAHMALTFGYFAFALFLISAIPAGAVEAATPSIASWAIALAATFLHLATMGAFVYRWLAVREVVPEDAPAAPAAPRRPARGSLR